MNLNKIITNIFIFSLIHICFPLQVNAQNLDLLFNDVEFYDKGITINSIDVNVVDTITTSREIYSNDVYKLEIIITGKISCLFSTNKYIEKVGFINIYDMDGNDSIPFETLNILLFKGHSNQKRFNMTYLKSNVFFNYFELIVIYNYTSDIEGEGNYYVQCYDVKKEFYPANCTIPRSPD